MSRTSVILHTINRPKHNISKTDKTKSKNTVSLGETNYTEMYLTFKTIDNCEFYNEFLNLQYSLNNGTTWATLPVNQRVTVNKEKTILWKFNATSLPNTTRPLAFKGNGKFNVYGNVLSILYGDSFKDKTDFDNKDRYFSCLFLGSNVVDASNLILPIKTLVPHCYEQMFKGCTYLTKAPKLTALKLAPYCYSNMFYGCRNLAEIPELTAKDLPENCYNDMFTKCMLEKIVICGSLMNGMFNHCLDEDSHIYITTDNIVIPNNAFINPHGNGSLHLNPQSKWITDDNFLTQFNGWWLYVGNMFIGQIEPKV